jgi:hypothetical protein
MRIAVVASVLGLASSGCIALSARAHVDAVTDFQRPGIQVGINVGMGYAGKTTAMVASLGVDSGTAPTLGIHDTFDYIHLPGPDLGWRVGFGTTVALVGEPTFVGPRVATLFPLRQRKSSYQSEKMGGHSSSSRYAISIEAALGASTSNVLEPPDDEIDLRVGASAGVGLELYYLSRMWL